MLSKIEAGQLSLLYAPTNVADVAESACLLCFDMAASKGLILSWYVDPELPPRLMMDAARVQQILINLLSNGIKFTRSRHTERERAKVTSKGKESISA